MRDFLWSPRSPCLSETAPWEECQLVGGSTLGFKDFQVYAWRVSGSDGFRIQASSASCLPRDSKTT